ncbi:outer membrane lipoprotein carrier protein LolA [bacterium]|nr:outer membrane lipoprotein carrier protein LolA [bacterium]
MKNSRILPIVLIMLGTLLPRAADGGDAEKLVEQVEKAVKAAKTLEIVFQEKYVWEMTGEENMIEGSLVMSGDDRFRVETEDQILVSDGTTLWTYSKPAHRVLIDRLAETDEALLPRQLLLQYTQGHVPRKLQPEKIDGVTCEVLLFTDSEGRSFFKKWQVWIDPGTSLPKRLLQEDLNGNQNIYEIKSIRTGIDIGKDVFHFEIPEGAEVIDM